MLIDEYEARQKEKKRVREGGGEAGRRNSLIRARAHMYAYTWVKYKNLTICVNATVKPASIRDMLQRATLFAAEHCRAVRAHGIRQTGCNRVPPISESRKIEN